jgi:hypothetical protein
VSKVRLGLAVGVLLVLFLSLLIMQFGSSHSGQAPVASFIYSPDVPGPGETITFNASASYAPDGWIVQYTWNFGDGNVTTVTNPIITYAYAVDGRYTVELTVTDNSGLTGVASAVIEVSTVVFFRACPYGTLVGMSDVEVTAYYNNGTAWVKTPVGPDGFETRYDLLTQPYLAPIGQEKYRNPGLTASILSDDASNIGFDLHPSRWTVYFKFQYGPYVAYWPNDTTTVYSYNRGVVETHDYLQGHQAYWDAVAGTYVIKVNDIPGHGVCPTERHPIIVILCVPRPSCGFYLTVKTDPAGITTIRGEGWYGKGTNVTLSAPGYVCVSADTRHRFNYWDVDGTSQGSGVNPITVCMNANHTATAHYILQYSAVFKQTGLSTDATGTVVTVNSVGKNLTSLPYTLWLDNGSSMTYSYNPTVPSTVSGKQFRLACVAGSSSPITVTGPATITGNYVTQYLVTFARTGLDSDATGTVVTVNASAKTFANLPFIWWVDAGSSVSYSYSSIVSSSAQGKQFRLNSVSGASSPFTVTASVTLTGSYILQYSVTFTHTGLDSTAVGSVVTVNGNTKGFGDLPFTVWVDNGSSVTYSYNDIVLSGVTGERFKQTSVTGPGSPITVTGAVTVTGNYKTQYKITFDQAGVGTDFTGTVVSIDSANYNVSDLPVSFWWDQSSSHNFSFASPLGVSGNKQYCWNSTSGLSNLQGGTLTVTASGSVIGDYIAQNSITFDQLGVSSDFTGTVVVIDGTPYGVATLPVSFNWSVGSVHIFAFQSPLVVAANAKQYVWTSTTGLSTLQSGSINVTTYGSIVGNYKTQYYLTLATNPPAVTSPSGAGWYDANTYATMSTAALVDIVPGSSRYRFNSWTTADTAEITDPTASSTTVLMDKAKTVTANYVTQYMVTFSQSGVGSDFTGTAITVDGTGYTVGTLPTSFWWDNGTSHIFSFSSPLVVNSSLSYVWVSTTGGLSALQGGTLVITGSGTVTGNYVVHIKCQITFSQTGVDVDFTGSVVTIDGVNYGVGDLPVSFWWDTGSSHSFSFASPLSAVGGKQYVWTNTTGLSTLQSDPLTVSGSGSVTGNYKTQYYLSLTTDPSGVNTPSGSGWYDAGTSANVSTDAFVDIVPGSSRYRFNGWTTADTTEIADPTRSPTTVLMDKAKTVTADYVVQYQATFNQSGVGSDFTGSIVAIDGVDHYFTGLPVSFWWDNSSVHTFVWNSPLVVTANAKQYVWINTAGLSTLQSDSITVSGSGSVTGNYKAQYVLTVLTDPTGLSPQPTRNPAGEAGPANGWWYNASTTVTLTAQPVTWYKFNYWDVDGASQSNGVNPITVSMDAPHTATAHYTFTPLSASISPSSATICIGGSVNLASIVSGGTSPYSYQWYLDGNLVSGATSSSWTYAPTSASTHSVYFIVIDASHNTVQSDPAIITVLPKPVGGYSTALVEQAPTSLIAAYTALIALFAAILSLTRRKRK